MAEKLLTADEVAEELCVPRATLHMWRYQGVGPLGIKVGRHLRYRRVDLDKWLDKQVSLSAGRQRP